MASERNGQQITFICDECDRDLQAASHDFIEAWESAKEEGWRCFKTNGEWEHRCPDCVGLSRNR